MNWRKSLLVTVKGPTKLGPPERVLNRKYSGLKSFTSLLKEGENGQQVRSGNEGGGKKRICAIERDRKEGGEELFK